MKNLKGSYTSLLFVFPSVGPFYASCVIPGRVLNNARSPDRDTVECCKHGRQQDAVTLSVYEPITYVTYMNASVPLSPQQVCLGRQ